MEETSTIHNCLLMDKAYKEKETETESNKEVYLAPMNNSSMYAGFPTEDWIIEETLEDVGTGTGTEAIDRCIIQPTKKGLVALLGLFVQPTCTDVVILQGKLGKVKNISILLKDKENDPHQPYVIKYKDQAFTTVYLAKDEIYYLTIMKASKEEKQVALEAYQRRWALYAVASKKQEISKLMIHQCYRHPKVAIIKNLIQRLEMNGIKIIGKDEELKCVACNLAKMVPLPSKAQDKSQRMNVLPGEKWLHDL
ncbi:hypothetical protein HK100_004426 [Physocladia obscura]|uniref:Uncharacterized protein n=1 Tax=Physocladia obscura TaxID=109957 RepID=A0AAD5SYJ1_9FUNG|nr:hypothetical protein HK100_004426 [Physocladia obscura]